MKDNYWYEQYKGMLSERDAANARADRLYNRLNDCLATLRSVHSDLNSSGSRRCVVAAIAVACETMGIDPGSPDIRTDAAHARIVNLEDAIREFVDWDESPFPRALGGREMFSRLRSVLED